MANELFGLFGSHLFDDRVMRDAPAAAAYTNRLREIRDEGQALEPGGCGYCGRRDAGLGHGAGCDALCALVQRP